MAEDPEILEERERWIRLTDEARDKGADLARGGAGEHWPTYREAFELARCGLLLGSTAVYVAPDAEPDQGAVEVHWRNLMRVRDMARRIYGHEIVLEPELMTARFVVSCYRGDHDQGNIALDAMTFALSSMLTYTQRSQMFDVAEFPGPDAWVLASASWEVLTGWATYESHTPEDYYVRSNEPVVNAAQVERVNNTIRQAGGQPPSNN